MLAASAAALCMPVDISSVTVLCSSMAAAVDVTYSPTLWIRFLIDVNDVATSAEMPLSDTGAQGIECARDFTSAERRFSLPNSNVHSSFATALVREPSHSADRNNLS
jgi:hypothetical protein